MPSQIPTTNLPPTPPELPVSYGLVKIALRASNSWAVYPHRDNLYLHCDPAAYRFRVIYRVETVADVDIRSVRELKECPVHLDPPAFTMKYAGGKNKLYLKFRHREDCERVVALLGRLGVEVREGRAGVGSRQTGIGTPAQFGIESQIHLAMKKQ